MRYSVLYADTLIGTADLTPAADDPAVLKGRVQAPAPGVLVGPFTPTAAYASVRAICQGPTQVLERDEDADAPPSREALGDFAEALGRIWALSLTLQDAEGRLVPTHQVLVQDFTPAGPTPGDLPPEFSAITVMAKLDLDHAPGVPAPGHAAG